MTTTQNASPIEIKRHRMQQLLDAAWVAPDSLTQNAYIAEATEIAVEIKALQS